MSALLGFREKAEIKGMTAGLHRKSKNVKTYGNANEGYILRTKLQRPPVAPAFATPDNADMGEPAQQNAVVPLQPKVQNEWLLWKPKINLTA